MTSVRKSSAEQMAWVLFDRFEPGARRRGQKTVSFTIDDVPFVLGELSQEQRRAWESWTTARQDAELARLLELFERESPQKAKEAASLLEELEKAKDEPEFERTREKLLQLLHEIGGAAGEATKQMVAEIATALVERQLGLRP